MGDSPTAAVHTAPADRGGRDAAWPWLAALAYTAFPIYGSLVPFRLQHKALEAGWREFEAVLAGPLDIASRADFAANVLLALPLALLWMAAAVGDVRRRSRFATAAIAAGVWLACAALAVGLEFAQVFFSGRQPALSDVVAQTLGAGFGLLAWRLMPASLWQRAAGRQAPWQRLAALYLGGLVLYAVLPLDLTVSRSELVGKVKAGMVRLTPFDGWAAQPMMGLLGFAGDAAIWFGAAWLLRMARRGTLGAWTLWLCALAIALEVAQFFVLSRVVDATDVIAAALGISIAAAVPSTGKVSPAAADGGVLRRGWAPLLAAAAVLAAGLWPFDFVTDPAPWRQRYGTLSLVPFASYLAGSELTLVTGVLRRLVLFAGVGAAVQWALPMWPLRSTRQTGMVVLACFLLAALLEVLQFFLPGGVVDVGDPLLAAAAGAAGALLLRWVGGGRGRVPDSGAPHGLAANRRPERDNLGGDAQPLRPRPAAAVVSALVLLLCLMAASYVDTLPYNVRELLAPGGVPWPALPITVALLVVFGAPAWLAQAAAGGRAGSTGAALVGLPLVLAVLTVAGAPRESVHDVVGTPVLGVWPWGELVVRMAVLLLGLLWSVAFGVAVGGPRLHQGRRAVATANLAVHGVWVVALWHGVVVAAAATDNLTELMAGGGTVWSTLCVLSYGALVGAAASRALARTRGGALFARVAGAAGIVLLSGGVGYLLASWGSDDLIVKYGRAFSALQFLLSAERDAYVAGGALVVRFMVAHAAAVGVAMVAMSCAGTLQRVVSSRGGVPKGRLTSREISAATGEPAGLRSR